MKATLLALGLLLALSTNAQIPNGVTKLTSPFEDYSGSVDGLVDDVQNSYTWSGEFFGDYVYLSTLRNLSIQLLIDGETPRDNRGRIYRMPRNGDGSDIEEFYVSPTESIEGNTTTGTDIGFRAMKTFEARRADPVLYVGSASGEFGGGGKARLLAITEDDQVTEIFSVDGVEGQGLDFLNIRAITEHQNTLFWAARDFDNDGRPVIWSSPNPLADFNNENGFTRLDVPENWFPEGAEIWDMISYNGYLYAFFIVLDPTFQTGFWCAKVDPNEGESSWELIVGDEESGAIYPDGLGRAFNAHGTPFLYRGKVYVGTFSSLAGRIFAAAEGDLSEIPFTFQELYTASCQIYRFDEEDVWERVMPASFIEDDFLVTERNGFGNFLNAYVWRFGVHDGRLYAATYDSGVFFDFFLNSIDFGGDGDGGGGIPFEITPLDIYILLRVFIEPRGFDLYSTTNGRTWRKESETGFDDGNNYGIRLFLTDPNSGDMFMGTANAFFGTQLWKKESRLPWWIRLIINRRI